MGLNNPTLLFGKYFYFYNLSKQSPNLLKKAMVTNFQEFLFVLIFIFTCTVNVYAQDSKPNIIIILSDDAGYGDFGFQGSTEFKTPNLDRIAKGGIRFTNGYVSASVCSPSRAGLLTGRYQQRFGHEYNLPTKTVVKGDDEALRGLPLSEKTLADVLKGNGYKTGIIGKWHLGDAPKYHPNNRGFDYFFGMLAGSTDYFQEKRQKRGQKFQIQRNGEYIKKELPYLTDAFGFEAVQFIEKNWQTPFFLYLSFNAVHTPIQAKKDDMEYYAGQKKVIRQKLAAMNKAMDDQVGNVLDKLQELGLAENTLLFFLNDNGGPTPHNGSLNGHLRGMKGTLLEGGVRVPFLIHWPAKLRKGLVVDEPVISLDIFTTCMAATGITLPNPENYDGINLLPYLSEKSTPIPERTLYWRRAKSAAIRDGNWKLIRLPDRMPLLFDLESDEAEQHNLALKNPALVEDLLYKLFEWEKELTHPVFRTEYYWIKFNLRQYDQNWIMEKYNSLE